MPTSEELSAALLEKAREQHENARSNFSRDLKVAALALLVFQFFVFFPFTRLSDRLLALQPQLQQALTDGRALADVQTSLVAFKRALTSGADAVTEALRRVPQDIRDQLAQLDAELREFRASSVTASPVQQMRGLQSNLAMSARGTVGGLVGTAARDEQRTLHDAKEDDPAYQQLVSRLVETQIIQPVFRRLNLQVDTLLGQPLERELAGSRSQTAAVATLRKTGAGVDTWLTDAERVVALVGKLRFEPPARRDWWTSAQTKAEFASLAQLDTKRIADEAKSALSRQEGELSSLAKKMETALADLRQQEEKLEAESERLQASANSLQSLIEGYARPLATIALNPRDLVLYYPVVLAAVIAMFSVRQILLRRRAAELARVYRELGLSPAILALYFSELPALAGNGTPMRSSEVSPVLRPFATLWWLAPVALVVASVAWILASASLGAEAPRVLYLVSGLVLAAAFALQITERKSDSQRERLKMVSLL